MSFSSLGTPPRLGPLAFSGGLFLCHAGVTNPFEAAAARAPCRRDTVIKAFRNVADSLAPRGRTRAVKETRVAEDAARKHLDKIRVRSRFGGVSQLEVVDAQRGLLNAATLRVQAEALRLTNTVALFVALGGG